MPKLPTGKLHNEPHGNAVGETVSTNSPARTRSQAKRLAEATKKRFESVFPPGFTAEAYAEALIRKCASFPNKTRSREVDSTIDKLLSLERLCFSFELIDRADFFRQTKRLYVSHLLESILPKLREADYREQALESWSRWLYAKGFVDIGDFWFWNGWRDRFFAEEHVRQDDIPLNF